MLVVLPTPSRKQELFGAKEKMKSQRGRVAAVPAALWAANGHSGQRKASPALAGPWGWARGAAACVVCGLLGEELWVNLLHAGFSPARKLRTKVTSGL